MPVCVGAVYHSGLTDSCGNQLGPTGRVADRYAYLALLGPALALAYLLATYRNWHLYTGVSAVLLCLAGLSILQIGYWDNGVKLWAHAASVSGSDTAYYSLGLQYSGNGMPYAAIDSFSRATQVNPSYADAHVALGTALLNIGHISQAVVELHRAIRLQPHRREAHFKLGIALAEAGQKSQALAEFREAIRLTTDRAERQRQERALRTLQRNLDSSH